MRMTMRYVRAIYALTIALLLVPEPLRSDQTQPTPSANLADLFAPGGLLQDRNGDGVIDYVNVRIVLGPAASASDVSAASDIAARLGFETSAMDIPLGGGPGRTTIAIGPAGAEAAGLSTQWPSRASGEGVVELRDAASGPVLLVGGSDEGATRSAAEWLAGHFPRVWDPNGATLEQVVADVKAFLAAVPVDVAGVRVSAAHVRANAEG